MNKYEQRVQELAYQIWESEGRPVGHEYRHWEMAYKQAATPVNTDTKEMGTGHILSAIAPEQPPKPDHLPEIDPAPPQPGQPTPPAKPEVPVDPISPIESPPHISPTPPAQPIKPYANI
jgi:hypothetical protein